MRVILDAWEGGVEPREVKFRHWREERVIWEPVRILVASPDAHARQGICTVLLQMGDMVVVGEAASGQEAAAQVQELVPDVVLVDADMAGPSAIESTRQILRQNPHIGVLLIAGAEDPDLILRAMRAGARGYVLRDASTRTLRMRVRAAFRGEVLISGVIARTLLHRIRTGRSTPLEKSASDGLTPRERQVLQLAGEGLANKEIATRLLLSEKTVRNYMNGVFSKLQVHDRTQAVLAALRDGVVTLPEEEDGS